MICATLREFNGGVVLSASSLGVDRSYLRYRMRRLGIDWHDYRPPSDYSRRQARRKIDPKNVMPPLPGWDEP